MGRRGGRRQPLKPLIEGHRAICPHCRKDMDVLEIEVLSEIVAYEAETVPVLRCPFCRWVWALRAGGESMRRTA
jgi:hypothetical protein